MELVLDLHQSRIQASEEPYFQLTLSNKDDFMDMSSGPLTIWPKTETTITASYKVLESTDEFKVFHFPDDKVLVLLAIIQNAGQE